MERLSPDVRTLYERRLWHELTEALLELESSHLLEIWDFVYSFSEKLNQVRLVELAIKAASTLTGAEGHGFLERLTLSDKQASLLLQAALATKYLEAGDASKALALLEQVHQQVEEQGDLDQSIYSQLYKSLALAHQAKGHREQFYRFGLQYLAYTPPSKIANAQQFSVDLALAVLLSESIFNLGELLEQPVIKQLQGTQSEWIYTLLSLCNSGRVAEFEAAVKSQPSSSELVSELPSLLIKVRILALIEQIFTSGQWVLTFSQVAETTHTSEDESEFLLMKAMAKGLIRGEIDEVQRKVKISYILPRALDSEHLGVIQRRVVDWRSSIQTVVNHLEDQAKELFD
jgi:26S proteasome regulatory subunit N9